MYALKLRGFPVCLSIVLKYRAATATLYLSIALMWRLDITQVSSCHCHAVSFYSPHVAVGHYSSIELPLPCVTLDRCQKSNCFCHASVIFSISFESVPNAYSFCLWIALRCLNCYCQLWLWIVLKYLELPSKI